MTRTKMIKITGYDFEERRPIFFPETVNIPETRDEYGFRTKGQELFIIANEKEIPVKFANDIDIYRHHVRKELLPFIFSGVEVETGDWKSSLILYSILDYLGIHSKNPSYDSSLPEGGYEFKINLSILIGLISDGWIKKSMNIISTHIHISDPVIIQNFAQQYLFWRKRNKYLMTELNDRWIEMSFGRKFNSYAEPRIEQYVDNRYAAITIPLIDVKLEENKMVIYSERPTIEIRVTRIKNKKTLIRFLKFIQGIRHGLGIREAILYALNKYQLPKKIRNKFQIMLGWGEEGYKSLEDLQPEEIFEEFEEEEEKVCADC